MKIQELDIIKSNNCLLNDDEKIIINNIISDAIRKQKSNTIDEYSNNALGVCLKDLINCGVEKSGILEYKKYHNSIYFIKNEFVFLYRRNNYYITKTTIANYYKSAKKFISSYNISSKQMEFNFKDVETKAELSDKNIFLLFLDFDINELRNNLDNIFYNLYFLTIENEKIVNCVNITNLKNISKVYDTSNSKKTDIDSKTPIVQRKKNEIRKTND